MLPALQHIMESAIEYQAGTRVAVSIADGRTEKARLHEVRCLKAAPKGMRVLYAMLARRRRSRSLDCIVIADQAFADRDLIDNRRD
jgi:hypothetical protein